MARSRTSVCWVVSSNRFSAASARVTASRNFFMRASAARSAATETSITSMPALKYATSSSPGWATSNRRAGSFFRSWTETFSYTTRDCSYLATIGTSMPENTGDDARFVTISNCEARVLSFVSTAPLRSSRCPMVVSRRLAIEPTTGDWFSMASGGGGGLGVRTSKVGVTRASSTGLLKSSKLAASCSGFAISKFGRNATAASRLNPRSTTSGSIPRALATVR